MKKKYVFISIALLSAYTKLLAGNFTFFTGTFTSTPTNNIQVIASGCSLMNDAWIGITASTSIPKNRLHYDIITNTLPDTLCWMTELCDDHQCASSPLPTGGVLAYSLSPGSNINRFKFGINPRNHSGNAILQILVYDINDLTNNDTLTFNVTGCTTGTSCTQGISDMPAIENTMSIYPNPVKDLLTIKTSNATFFSEKKIGIYNILGEKILSFKLGNAQTNKIDVAALKAGVYFVRYETEKGNTVTEKFYKSAE